MEADDLSKRLADAASSLTPERALDPASIANTVRRSHRRRRSARLGLLGALALIGGAVGVGQLLATGDPAVETTADGSGVVGWERLSDPPLSPRSGATAAWDGEEVVVVGGWDFLCPPNASCVAPDEPAFSDGAAYDPTTGRWRSISPAPTAVYGEAAAVVGGDLYLLVGCDVAHAGSGTADACTAAGANVVFIRYDAGADEWTVLETPPGGRDYLLAPAGRFVIAYAGSDESGEVPDLLFDTSSSTWQEIPDDPLPPMFDRTVVTPDDGDTLILIGAPIERSSEPSETQNLVARFDVASQVWEELPSPPGRGYRGWGVDDVVVLEPHFGGHGGQLDPAAETWTELPAAPEGWDANAIAGVTGRSNAVYTAASGWVLDREGARWIELSPPDERATFPDTNVTAVGRDLFAYGGESWETSGGELLGDAWIWRAPRDDEKEPSATTTTAPSQPGQVTIELVDSPVYIEGWDLAVRVTPAGGETIERQLEDFSGDEVAGWGQPGGSWSLTLDVPSGTALVQAHLIIGIGPGPAEPDFVAREAGGSLCSPVEVAVPAGGEATAQIDWKTGCLESDDALDPVPSDLLPGRSPEASGAIVAPFSGDGDRRLQLVVSTGQDEYFHYARLYLGDAVIVSGASGDEVSADELITGTRVDVWTTGCDDTAPPVCTVTAVRIKR